MLLGARRVFTRRMLEVHWEFAEENRELVENSPEVYQEVHREFADRLSGARQEFTGRMLGVGWEFVEENRELVGDSSKGCREFTERQSDNEDFVLRVIVSIIMRVSFY
ncbi:hypothetical protein BHE74_00042475 [Ensete ventricosum]|nr:hypothetical protein BHE74_00042475 [Ensete ventricosum]